MRVGITILPEHPWSVAAGLWRRAEELGFDHAWTYDHVVWGGLQGSPWFGTTPTLAAAATVTERIRLGTFVTSPNYRHPVPFMRDILALDDISAGRFVCGIGSGGTLDATICGGAPLTPREKVDRLEEFTSLLDELLLGDHVTREGRWFSARDVRTAPGCQQRPRVPFVIAANGPRAMAVAARHGQGWVTTGPQVDEVDAWWRGVADLVARLDDVLAQHQRARGDGFDTFLSLDASPRFSLESVGAFEEAVGRAQDLGFSDVITHWPRPDGPYAGSLATLERVAADVLPAVRAAHPQ